MVRESPLRPINGVCANFAHTGAHFTMSAKPMSSNFLSGAVKTTQESRRGPSE
jgi:hypothetical protein